MLKTHHSQHGYLQGKVKCDQCGVIVSTSDRNQNFSQITEELKYSGWYSYRNVGKWEHACPNCSHLSTEEHKDDFQKLLAKRKLKEELLKQYKLSNNSK